MLEITASNLQKCAERWGWLVHPDQWFAFTSEGFKFYTDVADGTNAAAILDRITHLTRNGGSVAIFADLLGFSWWDKGQARHVDVPAPTDESPNQLSWLLVELTKQLPPEVWQ